MSFPRYPAYKDSGVEWLGEVPAHWETCAVKRIADLKSGESITAEDIEEEGDFPVFGGNGLRGFATHYTHDGTFALIGRQGALCGNINYATGKFWASEHAVVATPKVEVETHWLGELMRAMNLNQYSVSAAQPGLSVEIVGNLRIPVPPTHEQTAIARFLDHETAKIDALVAEQQKLIALLQEKRQATISHAVTKGLDPTVPMKDSGVEWLGEVPAHWEVIALKRLIEVGSTISYGIVQPGEPLEDGVPFIQTTNMSSGRFDPLELQKTTEAIARQYPRSRLLGGEVILGIRASIGAAFVVPDELAGVNLSRGVARIQCSDRLQVAYLVQFLMGRAVESYWQLAKQGSTFNEVSIETVRELTVAVPPGEEQEAIAAHLNRETAKLDALMAEAQSAITLLQERRTALISAAVTGQIDVRQVSP